MGQTVGNIIATTTVTISWIIDIVSTTRYYCLSLDEPEKPTTNPPSEAWTIVEPPYTSGSMESLYIIDCTVFTNDTFQYSEVSKSSNYDAVNAIQVGGRNLIRNSTNLIFDDYYFISVNEQS